MKRFLRYIPVFLVCLILAVTPVLMCVSASAASSEEDSPSAVCPALPDLVLPDVATSYLSNYVIFVTNYGVVIHFPLVADSSFSVSLADSTFAFENAQIWTKYDDEAAFQLTSDSGSKTYSASVGQVSEIYYGSQVSFPSLSSYTGVISCVDLEVPSVHVPAAGLGDILSVFSTIGSKISSLASSLISIFYTADSGLTVLGILSCCSLGVGLVFLILRLLSNFMHWR